MQRALTIFLSFLALLAVLPVSAAGAEPSEKRLALVIGNASYHAKALATPVNDAALIAQTLQAAGFEVMGARDLDQDSLRRAFRDFVDGVTRAGPQTVAAVYFAGYGLQFEGENYLLPIDADITSASDVPLKALRLSDEMHALAALRLKMSFVILDAARASPFALSGRPLAGGLAWVEPETNMLIAFNAAPGTIAPDGGDGYGPYAKALAEMIREGSLMPANVFDRVRLRVNELTKGAQVPWTTSRAETPFVFFERGPAAPPRSDSPGRTAWMRSQPMRSLGPDDAYMTALLRDTFDGYADFLADYGSGPMGKRVRAILAARREAIAWRRTCQANVSEAYWSYLKRYPNGPHTADAGRLLARLGVTIEPPSKFAMMEYDVPTPLPEEFKYIERPVLVFDDPAFAFESPPPSPRYFLEPPPAEFLALVPPPAPHGSESLPGPVNIPLPVYISAPAYVVAPPDPVIFNKTHKAPVIGNMNKAANKAANKADGQAVSFSILPPGRTGDAKDPGGSRPLPRSGAPMAPLPHSPSPPPPTPREAIETPVGQPLPAMLSISALPADDRTPATARIAPRVPLTDDPKESPVQGLDILAPPAAGSILRQTPAILLPQASGSTPLSQPLPAISSIPGLAAEGQALANARIATLGPTNENKSLPVLGSEMLDPLAATRSTPSLIPASVPPPVTGSIPLPIPRPVTPAPTTAENIPLPIPRPATFPAPAIASQAQPISSSAVPPSAANQAGQPIAPGKLASPATAIAGARAAAPGILQPPTPLCPVVNGRRICN